jgi:hypothetical protein
MSFKVVPELSRTHDYNATYLLHFQVVFLGADKSFRNKIYWNLVRQLSAFFGYFSFLYKGFANLYALQKRTKCVADLATDLLVWAISIYDL